MLDPYLILLIALLAPGPLVIWRFRRSKTMGKPFQFSMRRMFAAVAFFCIAVWPFKGLLTAFQNHDVLSHLGNLLMLFVLCAASLGAAAGSFKGKPLIGALLGVGWAIGSIATFVGLVVAMRH